jgi:hypothetical protein
MTAWPDGLALIASTDVLEILPELKNLDWNVWHLAQPLLGREPYKEWVNICLAFIRVVRYRQEQLRTSEAM